MRANLIVLLPLMLMPLPALAASGIAIEQLPQGAVARETTPPPVTPLAGFVLSQVTPCWNPPAVEAMTALPPVVIAVEFDRKGKAKHVALSKNNASDFKNDSAFRALAMSAIMAVQQCTPLKSLPKEPHKTWRRLELVFDAKRSVAP